MIDYAPAAYPIVCALVAGAALFALLAIGASMTYRVAAYPNGAVLAGAKLYAATAVMFIGATLLVIGLPS